MTNNSKVLALKYRPQVLKELVGQDVVASTIYNSIKFNKIPNAYLFTGIRGVGKTTFARIVAKSLNCKKGIDDINKQDSCENCHCEAIANSNHIDVLEMDAASKTGVDDVRDLIEFSRYGPTSAKYKIFIIDEVHMLSKQAFNALLKTLEEPPDYLKFIFATTEIKKIPVTVISRCQRFDLQRIKAEELLEFLKKIVNLEKGNVSEDALKLIVKISEGSVRDALSLLDRGIISLQDNEQLNLDKAREIFGYFDKSTLINLIKNIFEGNESEVTSTYKLIYEAGVDPKIFLNDFLEILYYFKNINSIKLGSTNFSLNDNEYNEIAKIAKTVDSKIILLFWQFTVSTLSELDVVSNQNISIEMFLTRLLYLKDSKKNTEVDKVKKKNLEDDNVNKVQKTENTVKETTKTVEQIKYVSQEEKAIPELKLKNNEENLKIKSFNQLIEICTIKKELKLKYELETNVNLVSFSKGKNEISSSNNLEKDFVKLLSEKLYKWTNLRWLILFSSSEGNPSIKDEITKKKAQLIKSEINSSEYKKIKNLIPDIELVDVKTEDSND